MRAAALLAAFALQATPAGQARIAWVLNPRVRDGTWVADPSYHLSAAIVAKLNGEISALEQATGAEIAVVIVDSTSGLTPFDFALALHRGWRVGKRGRDNGIVFLWVPAQRAVHISVGYGLEGVLPDRRVGRIRDSEVFPAFRRGAFDDGVLAGLRALAAAAREETMPRQGFTPAMERGAGPAARTGASQPAGAEGAALGGGEIAGGRGGFPWIWALLGAGALVLFYAVFVRRYRRYRPRPCPKGHGKMRRLGEAADNEYLDAAERLEERLKSVDYDVWLCDACGEMLKIPYRRWFSGYHVCPECKRRTVRVTTRTLRQATTSHEGRRRITERCKQCGWLKEHEETIPMRTRASSSGGSWSSGGGGGGGGGGGSSFGGGSSGGGGAGGRY